jgi:hypothetical protein
MQQRLHNKVAAMVLPDKEVEVEVDKDVQSK